MELVKRLSAPLLFLLLASYALFLSAYKPFHNWDVIGYIAAAESYEQKDIESLHAFTYGELRSTLPAAEYEDLAQEKGLGQGRGTAYRHVISTDSSAFKEQLPFYQIRPAYTGLIYLLHKAGVDIEFATHLISGIAVATALALLYLLSAPFLARPFIYLLPPLGILFGILDLARFSTPDGLALLAVMFAAYLYLKGLKGLLLAVLPALLCIRTDLILFTLPLLFFLLVFGTSNRWKVALSAAASLVVYFVIANYSGNPGWSTFFYCSTVQRCTHPISMPPTLTARNYFDALSAGTKELVSDTSFIFYLAMVTALFWLIRSRAKVTSWAIALSSPPAVLAVVSLAYVAGRFLILPAEWNRFFTVPYLVTAFSLFAMTTDYLQSSKSLCLRRMVSRLVAVAYPEPC